MTASVRVGAPAKINLLLRVLDRRADGFHEIETLFQAVALFDDVILSRRAAPGVTLEVLGADLGPTDDNLVTRAARSFLAHIARPDIGVHVLLRKHIPAGAGLGGGSSDAAATLRGLEVLLDHALPHDDLHALAAALGSDVPFLLGPDAYAAARGRGERLEPLPPLSPAWLVLALPPVTVATGPAYEALAESRRDRPQPPRVLPASAPADWAEITRGAVNDFEAVVAGRYPQVARALEVLAAGEPRLTMLSGSGGAAFALYEESEGARRAAVRARRADPAGRYEVVSTLPAIPAPGALGP